MPDPRDTYEPVAQYAARAFGIPERLFIQLISEQNPSWDPMSRGQRGKLGLGQLDADTAATLADTWGEDFNPMKGEEALYASARYLASLRDKHGGNWKRAVLEYGLGAGEAGKIIQGGPLQRTKAFDGGFYSNEFVNSVLKDVDTKGTAQRTTGAPLFEDFLRTIGAKSATSASAWASRRPDEGPRWEDFEGDPGGFYEAESKWLDNRAKRRTLEQAPLDDLTKYLDLVQGEMSLEIQRGNMSINQATQEFNRRLNAFEAGGTQFNNLLKSSVPKGAEYYPGLEPGNIYGMPAAPLNPQTTIQVDPYRDALSILGSTQDISQIQTGGGGDSFQRALELQDRVRSQGQAPSPTQYPQEEVSSGDISGIRNLFR